MNHDELLQAAMDAVDLAHNLMLTMRPVTTTAKGDRDMATDVDYTIEQQVRAMLATHTPHIRFLGEEEGATGSMNGRLVWCLDPVDGTVNFIHGSPLCGISLGLLDGDRPVVGVVDLPFLGNRYHAVEHRGAYRDGTPITCSTTRHLRDAVVAIGDYAVGQGADAKNKLRLPAANRLAATAQRVRMHGSAAIDLVWLADGRIDAMMMLASNNPWDTTAGVLIAREAGATMVDRHGKPHTANATDTLGANPDLIGELVDLTQMAINPG